MSTSLSIPLRSLCAGVLALLLVGMAAPAQAQMDDGELPKIDFSVNLAQHAQYLSVSVPSALENSKFGGESPDPIAGFQRIRAGLTASVQFSENVSGLLMLQQEPNDFGFNAVNPAVDFAILNLQVNDQLTLQTGTIVTGLINFRGFSDGPVVQGNPLINNSPADMITAGQGVKLIGSYDTFGFDLTINRGFGGALTGQSSTGLNFIGKARYTGSDMFKVGFGAATATGTSGLVFTGGDGDNIDLGDAVATPTQVPTVENGNVTTTTELTGASPTRGGVHPGLPDEIAVQADAKVMVGGADIDAWAGYTSSSQNDVTSAAAFGGLGLKFDVNEDFYVAGRFTGVSDQGDFADNAPSGASTTLTRIQGGIGYMLYDKALLKVEGFQQSYGDAGVTRPVPADSFFGVMTELSFNF